jgi:protein phosphatase
MALRRGGRRLPMEDVCIYEWPLRGLQEVFRDKHRDLSDYVMHHSNDSFCVDPQFGVFCIFDGHGGGDAAIAASQ